MNAHSRDSGDSEKKKIASEFGFLHMPCETGIGSQQRIIYVGLVSGNDMAELVEHHTSIVSGNE